MNWIDKILPVTTLILGFILSEFGKYFSDRKHEHKKLKKLLFNLLELRWLIKQDIEINRDITEYIKRMKIRLKEEFGEEVSEGVEYAIPMITEIFKKSLVKPEKINEIENNINSTLKELSEIHPVFAYELIGRFKIKEKLDSIEQYFETINNQIDQINKVEELKEFYSEIKNLVDPKLSTELTSEMDNHIKSIARKISRKTSKIVSEKLDFNNDNNSGLDEFIEEYIVEIKKTIPNFINQ